MDIGVLAKFLLPLTGLIVLVRQVKSWRQFSKANPDGEEATNSRKHLRGFLLLFMGILACAFSYILISPIAALCLSVVPIIGGWNIFVASYRKASGQHRRGTGRV